MARTYLSQSFGAVHPGSHSPSCLLLQLCQGSLGAENKIKSSFFLMSHFTALPLLNLLFCTYSPLKKKNFFFPPNFRHSAAVAAGPRGRKWSQMLLLWKHRALSGVRAPAGQQLEPQGRERAQCWPYPRSETQIAWEFIPKTQFYWRISLHTVKFTLFSVQFCEF